MPRTALLKSIKSQLLAKKEQLTRELHAGREELQENSGARSDSVDAAAVGESKFIASRLLEHEIQELNEIEAALARIAEKTYGICEGCDQPIGNERLEALPYSRFCIGCQKTRERYSRTTGAEDRNLPSDGDSDQPPMDSMKVS